MIQQYHSVTQVTPEAPAHPCLLQHNSQDAALLTNGLRKCSIYTQL
jgi:hypothetical protein